SLDLWDLHSFPTRRSSDLDSQIVRLEVQRDGRWTQIGESPIHPAARTATFRVENWDDSRDAAYRLAYTLKQADGARTEHYWTGTDRKSTRLNSSHVAISYA